MKRSKINRAIECLDDELIAAAAFAAPKKGGSKMTEKLTKLAAIAAVFALIIGAAFIFMRGPAGGGTLIALDVNPSLEIEVDDSDRIVDVKALNADAVTVLGGMELDDVDLETALNAIIGSMLKNGFISADQNSILISVDSDDAGKAQSLKESVASKVAALLSGSNIEASLITQTYEKDKKDESGKVSAAVEALIKRIIDAGLTNSNGLPYTHDQLCGLKVNELKLILESKNVTVEGIESSGTASEGKYIGRDRALEIALQKAGTTAGAVRDIDVELDLSKKTKAMIYEVEFDLGATEYEYEIDAISGAIVKEDIETDDEDIGGDDKIEVKPLPEEIISKPQAIAIALGDAGLSSEAVFDADCDLHNKNFYTVEFETAGAEYEYKIDAVSGEILYKKEKPQDPPKVDDDDNIAPPAEAITKEKAISIALADAGIGAEAAREIECEFEKSGNRSVFEVEFETAKSEYEYKIDASTGEIIKKKSEPND